MARIITLKLLIFVAFTLTSTYILNGQEKFINFNSKASTFFSTIPDQKKETKSDQLRHVNNEIDIFTVNRYDTKSKLKIENDLKAYAILKVNNFPSVYNEFKRNERTSFKLKVPISHAETITLKLAYHNIYADDFKVIEKSKSGDKIVKFKKPLHFTGIVEGQPKSTVGFTLVEDQLMGVISYGGHDYNLTLQERNESTHSYLLFRQEDYNHPLNFSCETINKGASFQEQVQKSRSRSLAEPINVYIECDYQMYLTNRRSINATTRYATDLFNMVANIFNTTAGININLSELVVWSRQDPYTEPILDSFISRNPSFNGHIAHLLSTAPNTYGVADRVSRCYDVNEELYSLSSGLNNSFNSNLSIFSWDIAVLAHELGHNLGADHTHACAWNGNNTAIDGCGYENEAGGCPGELPSGGGTIMSYCNWIEVGTDLSRGFHPQVAERMQQFVECLSSREGSPANCRERDSLSLVALYNSTNGHNWKKKDNWLSNRPLGEWYGVKTNRKGCVTDLSLADNNLNGNIPPVIGELSELNDLNLQVNNLNGSIPKEIGNLRNLAFLTIGFNNLSGTIPKEIGSLRELRSMQLAPNNLSGSIPSELGNLKELTYLEIARSNISGSIPRELGNLKKLLTLALQQNNLSGSIPSELGNLTELTLLSLGYNNLKGDIPVDLGNLLKLTYLELNNNSLSGTIPKNFERLRNLERMILSNNNLTGCFPDNLTALCYLTNSNILEYCSQNNRTLEGCQFDFRNNPQLPWQGDFKNFCNGESQIGAPCDDGDVQTKNDVIQSNCACRGESENNPISNENDLSILVQGEGTVFVGLGNMNYACSSFCEYTFDSQSNIQLTVSPAFGYRFVRWEGDVCNNSTNSNCSLTLLRDLSVRAIFEPDAIIDCGTHPDYNALMALYNHTGGSDWFNNDGWRQGAAGTDCDPCNFNGGTWYGISCENERVTCIDFDGVLDCGTGWSGCGPSTNTNNLVGTLPNEIGNLTHLKQLSFASNPFIGGDIPASLANLGSLKLLNFSCNNFTGCIPGQLLCLDVFSFSFNSKLPWRGPSDWYGTGAFCNSDPQIGAPCNDDDPNTQNDIIQSDCTCKGGPINTPTDDLILQVNGDGTILVTTNNMSYACSVNCSYTFDYSTDIQLTAIPAFGYRFLRWEGGNCNQITTPTCQFNLTSTQNVIAIFQPISTNNPNDCRNRDSLSLVTFYNEMDGPNWINNTNWLSDRPMGEWYGVQTNAQGCVSSLKLDGSIGTNSIVNGNGLNGTLPDALWTLTELEELSISDGNSNGVIRGRIDDRLLNLTKLKKLLITGGVNRLIEGYIPSNIGDLKGLETIFLANNKLTGGLPASIGQLENLEYLVLYNNRLSGNLPNTVGNLKSLRRFSIYGNRFTGIIPASITQLSSLSSWDFSYNQFSGEIPTNLSSLKELRYLYLSNNNLSGTIPNELSQLTKLISLHLENNRLTGSIPIHLGDLSSLEQINLSSNQLSGCFPQSLRKLCYLTNLLVNDFNCRWNDNELKGCQYDFRNNPNLPRGGSFEDFCNYDFGVCNSLKSPPIEGTNSRSQVINNSLTILKKESIQNRPNPFSSFTILPITLEDNTIVHLEIVSVTGERIYQEKLDLPSGENQIELKGELFPKSGIYFYQIQTENQLFSGKMSKF